MKTIRTELVLERGEYLSRAREFCLRGEDLPHSKLSENDVYEIRSMIKQKEKMRKYIKENLSNDAISQKFNVHIRTIEKISNYSSWAHLIDDN